MRKSFVRLRPDHKGHLIAGVLISLAVAIIGWFVVRPEIAAIAVVLITYVIAWGKEVFRDWLAGRGTPEYSDAWITVGPSGLVAAGVLVVAEVLQYFGWVIP